MKKIDLKLVSLKFNVSYKCFLEKLRTLGFQDKEGYLITNESQKQEIQSIARQLAKEKTCQNPNKISLEKSVSYTQEFLETIKGHSLEDLQRYFPIERYKLKRILKEWHIREFKGIYQVSGY